MKFPNYICTAPPGVNVRVLALTRDNIKFQAGPMVADLPAVSLYLPDYKLSSESTASTTEELSVPSVQISVPFGRLFPP